MAERLIAAVLKTAVGDEPTVGSNPSLSAELIFATKRKITNNPAKARQYYLQRAFRFSDTLSEAKKSAKKRTTSLGQSRAIFFALLNPLFFIIW